MASSHYKLDLHTHSIRSHDGSITFQDYSDLLDKKILDFVAITDHNTISYAQEVKKTLGDKIIVGEEIWTADGEVIGLFLEEVIPKDLSLEKTIALIREQQGLIYIPHPFCRNRFGVSEEVLLPFLDMVDIMEYFNPRNIFRGDNERARQFILQHRKVMAASSDSHCRKEVGLTYSHISAVPTKQHLVSLLQQATYSCRYPSKVHLFCPKKNKLKKIFHML